MLVMRRGAAIQKGVPVVASHRQIPILLMEVDA
jgi:hypothetical protein